MYDLITISFNQKNHSQLKGPSESTGFQKVAGPLSLIASAVGAIVGLFKNNPSREDFFAARELVSLELVNQYQASYGYSAERMMAYFRHRFGIGGVPPGLSGNERNLVDAWVNILDQFGLAFSQSKTFDRFSGHWQEQINKLTAAAQALVNTFQPESGTQGALEAFIGPLTNTKILIAGAGLLGGLALIYTFVD